MGEREGLAKPGQLWRKDPWSMDEFLLKDVGTGLCLRNSNNNPAADECPSGLNSNDVWPFKWRWVNSGLNLQNVQTGTCFDANDGHEPLLYPCYEEGTNPKQAVTLSSQGRIKVEFSKSCLDMAPGAKGSVSVDRCDGSKWERLNPTISP